MKKLILELDNGTIIAVSNQGQIANTHTDLTDVAHNSDWVFVSLWNINTKEILTLQRLRGKDEWKFGTDWMYRCIYQGETQTSIPRVLRAYWVWGEDRGVEIQRFSNFMKRSMD